MQRYYLPEWHDFVYTAAAPWPVILNSQEQLDWVAAVETLEQWLNRYVGSHHQEWAYHNGTTVDYWTACVAFRRERNCTLFLLTWT